MILGDDERQKLLPINQDKALLGDVTSVIDGTIQLHLTPKDITNSFRLGHVVNPLERGHIAYRTNDIETFMVHLDKCGVPYSD